LSGDAKSNGSLVGGIILVAVTGSLAIYLVIVTLTGFAALPPPRWVFVAILGFWAAGLLVAGALNMRKGWKLLHGTTPVAG
jgi:hypothetical protein